MRQTHEKAKHKKRLIKKTILKFRYCINKHIEIVLKLVYHNWEPKISVICNSIWTIYYLSCSPFLIYGNLKYLLFVILSGLFIIFPAVHF